MKRFLAILVASIFWGSAAYAAESDKKVGIVGEERKADEKAKSDAKGGPTVEKKTGDRKVGFVGDEKKADEKAKSANAKAGTVPEKKTRDSKVGFVDEEKKAGAK